jgi:hypothetical protein
LGNRRRRRGDRHRLIRHPTNIRRRRLNATP